MTLHRLPRSAAALALSLAAAAPQAQTLPGFKFSSFEAPAGSNPKTCSTLANASAQIGTVELAQTHLLAPDHPFFHLSAGRATLVRAAVTGSGAAPAVWVRASAKGVSLGRICLSGPASLPASVNDQAPSSADSFTGTLPAAWLVPGLELTVQAGKAKKAFTAAQLKLGPAPELSFITADWLLFGDTVPTPMPVGFAEEFAAKLPLTRVRHANFPAKLAMAQLPIEPRSDGRTPQGSVGKQPAVLADAMPHCSSADKTAGTCTAWAGFGVLASVRNFTYAMQSANGMDELSHWYGALSQNRHAGGGLGGGVVSSGDDYGLTFNHELGHTFDMPHWGDALYERVAPGATQVHPYTGGWAKSDGTPVGGGYGNSWALDPLSGGGFINPVCASTGRERQEPMQRSGSACLAPGRIFDPFGDYSALFIHRYFTGAASVYAGTVASPRDAHGTAAAPFSFPTKGGRPNFVPATGASAPVLSRWDAASASYQALTPAKLSSDTRVFGERFPLQWNVPVYTLWGSFSSSTPAVTTLQKPLKYQGQLKRLWDPTQPADFAAMKAFISGDAFWWGADLVARAEFDNGVVRHALVKGWVRGADPLAGDSFRYWAVNIPVEAGAKLTRVSLYHRPMEVRYGDGGKPGSVYYTATNLNSSLNAALTAEHYLDGATLAATRRFAGL